MNRLQHEADFAKLEWESPIAGVRHKFIDQNGVRMRLVQYSKEMRVPPRGVQGCERSWLEYVPAERAEFRFSAASDVLNLPRLTAQRVTKAAFSCQIEQNEH